MNKALLRDTFRTIDRTKSRFISLVAIVALGVSFFAGINATAPDMRDTARQYYIDTNAMDLQVISTAGLTADDAYILSTINGVEAVSGEKFVDGVLLVDKQKVSDVDGAELIVRAYSLDVAKAIDAENGVDDRSFLNRPQLIEGSWPTQLNQCLVDASNLSTPEEFKIGATVTLQGAGTDMAGTLVNTDYTITGIIRSPLYISFDRGNTTIGTGKLGCFVYVPQENFKTDYYSSLSIKLEGTDRMDPYSEAYSDYVTPYVEYISSIAEERLAPRVASLRSQYTTLVTQGEADYNEAKTRIDQQIAAGAEQVAQILDLAQNGDAQLAEYKRQYNEKAAEVSAKIGSSKYEHSTQYATWEEKNRQYQETQAMLQQYSNAKTEYQLAKTEYETANNQVQSLLQMVNYLEQLVATTRAAITQLHATQDNAVDATIGRFLASGLVGSEVDSIVNSVRSLTAVGTAEEIAAYLEPQLQSLELQLANTRAQLQQTQAQLDAKKIELDNAAAMVAQLEQTQAQMNAAKAALDDAERALASASSDIQEGEMHALLELAQAKSDITAYETNLRLAKAQAATAEAAFEEQKAAAYAELDEARNKLEDAKTFLLNLDNAKWYVNDRNDALRGYDEYGSTADRTAALAIVFPWFFFIVSSLVCLNTMTRMVEDERTQLGTLKALGFTNKEIVFKYIFYALLASVIGGVTGMLIGSALFPFALTKAYAIMFAVPPTVLKIRPLYAIIGLATSIGTTVFAAYGACHRSLTAVPSTLMRPKAPKGGKRVLLERFPALWSRFNFTWKVTLRNVFRNKKRFIMAVIGVFGCTALLVAGFGLDKSINTSLEKQFTDSDSIFRYDLQIVTNGSDSATTADALNYVRSRPEIAAANLTYMKVFDTTSQEEPDKRMETYIVAPDDDACFQNYIYLRDYKTGEFLPLQQDGAIISRKLAKRLDLDVGDNIYVDLDDGTFLPIQVAAVAENYIFHYIYLSHGAYVSIFGAEPQYNYVSARLAYDLSPEQKENLSHDLMDEYSISALAYQDDIQRSFESIFDSLGYIVIVLVVSAGLLSLIVLYNLSSINIHERTKEIATIKVLGFTPREVSSYIFRENILIGIIGTLLGLLGGVGLHRIVIMVGEVDIIMFGRDAGVMAFVYATVLSMAFTLLVNLILRRNLNKVDMVESLKSIE